MSTLPFPQLTNYWSGSFVGVNAVIVLNLLGALLLGIVVGYERAYWGRAAGIRTYGLVCMASAALTVIVGYPAYWYGGGLLASGSADPTRVIQGIVTGIGFLGAGVIMRDGLNISGLTTAASIWTSSVIGVLVGLGFYVAAIMLTLTVAVSMFLLSRLEEWLPSRPAIGVVLRFAQGFTPEEPVLRRVALERGYDIPSSSLSISYQDGQPEWHFTAIALRKHRGASLSQLAIELSRFDGVVSFSMEPEHM
ncbi:MgtC/SapB family protein [Crenobacter sp. SG2305]|uniref:MgtC/SapB family protein n=1 Tax=Crenobacter oryzisoli TaxID=3056844 RepID=UPI0025AAD795|nr:MgtC/SapB family protein [Crenobacter sp. SG2305]MDN0084771.1 MgtC/SapB family protein [Crenobacter sp. SG2305]